VLSPVPLICGVGHETDFTIADFCADLRAPTPTAAAELAATPREAWVEALLRMEARLGDSVTSRVDVLAQRLDRAAARLGQPSVLVARQRFVLGRTAQRMTHAVRSEMQERRTTRDGLRAALPRAVRHAVSGQEHRLNRAALGLQLLDPALVLQRGYAWLSDADGNTVTRAAQLAPGDAVRATLADGAAELEVIGGKRTKRRSPTRRSADPS
ncbi:MAG: exodeoxyribonuclease VII large subunit, partial [Comamonadaceae bacterium]